MTELTNSEMVEIGKEYLVAGSSLLVIKVVGKDDKNVLYEFSSPDSLALGIHLIDRNVFDGLCIQEKYQHRELSNG